ncbi:MAG: NAD(P)H-hydrate dehydratase [Chloroherpetonaceae bacterium]|nr:NAD(P)H-hydrate dehydratase [Chloroherpetonaceae bacterium]
MTAETMREMDRMAIEASGIPGVVLMENAGRAVVEHMQREHGTLRGRRIVVLCGTGNNGGDGFVIARHLALRGADVLVALAGNPETIRGDARVNHNLLCRIGLDPSPAERVLETGVLEHADILVDALLGTGLRAAPRAPYDRVIAAVNRCARASVVAVDVPSGVDADTGAIPGEAVRAAFTVTFGAPKLGLLLFPGAEHTGKLYVADIGFPWERLALETPYHWIRPEAYRAVLPKRRPDTHKGDYGHVGILAGSQGMAGAAAMVAQAAQRAGAGLVTVLTPACVQPIVAAKVNEAMTLALPDADGAVAEGAFDAIAQFAARTAVLCAGPGLTNAPQVAPLILRVVEEIARPLVMDADGLNALAGHPEVARRRQERGLPALVLTPHPGEAARLLGTSIAQVQSNRVESAQRLAEQYHACVVLKGCRTLVADPEGHVGINTTGNPGMATGGSGDVLTGVIGGLLAQAFAADAALQEAQVRQIVEMAVMVHGMAGDIAARQQGEMPLVAGDIVACLPEALRCLEGSAE